MNWKLFSKCLCEYVTSLCFYDGWKLFSKCLCECYIWLVLWWRLEICECYILLSDYQNVYVNVTAMVLTWRFAIFLKMFMWMLHIIVKYSQNVHVNVTSMFYNELETILKMFMWMLHLYVFMLVGNFSQNVYVNVTSGWRLEICECYIVLLSDYQNVHMNVASMVLTWRFTILLKMFMWMLHLWY
jgi:hypothetical protein